jgi:hypothetical protein
MQGFTVYLSFNNWDMTFLQVSVFPILLTVFYPNTPCQFALLTRVPGENPWLSAECWQTLFTWVRTENWTHVLRGERRLLWRLRYRSQNWLHSKSRMVSASVGSASNKFFSHFPLKVTGHPFWRFVENRYCALKISPIFIKCSPNVSQCMQNMIKL